MDALTDRQQQVLDYLTLFINQHGYPPTLREISAAIGSSGTITAIRHLDALERKGYIRRDGGSSRGISLIRPAQAEILQVPIVGRVNAGPPDLAVEEVEGFYPLEQGQARGGAFFLRVRGDSMIEDAILDGDLALVRPQQTADNGDIVVVILDGAEATLKRFYREKDCIRLQPRNPTMQPIIISSEGECNVVGKVIRIIREID